MTRPELFHDDRSTFVVFRAPGSGGPWTEAASPAGTTARLADTGALKVAEGTDPLVSWVAPMGLKPSHLSIRQFIRPNDEVIALLVIVPTSRMLSSEPPTRHTARPQRDDRLVRRQRRDR